MTATPLRLFTEGHEPNSDDWYTPRWIFDGLGLTFDLDVAHPPYPTQVPARRYFTVADDGLAQDWAGLVWCNPPYSLPGVWCRRFAEHDEAILAVRADLSVAGIHVAYAAADAMYVPARRLQFAAPDGRKVGAVNFTTVLLARGPQCSAALFRLASLYGGTARQLVK